MKSLLVVLTMFLTTHSFSQSPEDSVKQTINKLFDGMRSSDTALLRSAFAPGSILQTVVKNKEAKVFLRTEPLDSFIAFIARPHKEIYDERISFEMIRIDGELATAWTPYQFYVDEKFSHCGVNSFQLVKLNGKWKIQYLVDTRRKQNCE